MKNKISVTIEINGKTYNDAQAFECADPLHKNEQSFARMVSVAETVFSHVHRDLFPTPEEIAEANTAE